VNAVREAMPKQPSPEAAENLVKKIANGLRKHVKSEIKKKWKSAILDVLTPTVNDGSWSGKLRVHLANGTVVATLGIAAEQIAPLMELMAMKDVVFDPKWYGIKITIFPNAPFEVAYNHDPNCDNDPTFFDFDE
jgi:hypothetical protein